MQGLKEAARGGGGGGGGGGAFVVRNVMSIWRAGLET
jgi:hypothetical protein